MHNIFIEQTKHSLLKKTVHKIDHKDFYRETAMLLYKTFLLNKSTFNVYYNIITDIGFYSLSHTSTSLHIPISFNKLIWT